MTARAELIRAAFLKFCEQFNINPDGQFAQEDGYLFDEGFKAGRRSKAPDVSSQELEEANDRAFRASEAHVVTMRKLQTLEQAAQAVLADALEYAEGDVHICDVKDDRVKLATLSTSLQKLYQVLKDEPPRAN